MAVELTPITDGDVAAVAEFLHANHNDSVPWGQSCAAVPWKGEPPNRGFMLRDGHRVVGTLLALYSERLVEGRTERFCNMGSWCVLPDYRSKSLALLRALLAQDGYHFTVLSPDEGPQEILAWHGFRFLDTAAVLIPNMPWPTLPGRTRISADPAVIESTLVGRDLELYHDHADALAAQHLVLITGQCSCYVMYRQFRFRGLGVFAMVLHVSNPDLFRRAWIPLTRHLLVRQRLVATLVELRLIAQRPGLSFPLNDWPKMFRSDTLGPAQVDLLYSELVCVPWSRGSPPRLTPSTRKSSTMRRD